MQIKFLEILNIFNNLMDGEISEEREKRKREEFYYKNFLLSEI